jgi:acetoin:2,6-dichlorophenolindophenol oxidoreductase subunit alpha
MSGANTVTVERMYALYETMVAIRVFDDLAGQARRDGRLRGSVHEYIGQEAIAAGVCASLRASDYISSYHRGHGHCLAKGADPFAMMKELFGKAGGVCGGKGGSMHVADFSRGILGANGVVADGVTIALGAAHAVRLRREDRIVVAFFGDGALNRGPMLEALNWARVFHLPVLFVCEDNGYSDRTRTKTVSAGPGPLARANAFGIRGEAIDGNDVKAVHETALKLLRAVRAGEGPAFLHAKTYRWRGHLALDRGLYRDPEELRTAAADDPIARAAAWLNARGIEGDRLESARAKIEARMRAAIAEAESAPWPSDDALVADVQDIGGPDWRS